MVFPVGAGPVFVQHPAGRHVGRVAADDQHLVVGQTVDVDVGRGPDVLETGYLNVEGVRVVDDVDRRAIRSAVVVVVHQPVGEVDTVDLIPLFDRRVDVGRIAGLV